MKKILILGASYSLLPLIRAAKRLGYRTAAASIPGDYPGFAAADESCYADITDPEQVLKAAASVGADGIALCSMDIGLRSQGYVNSRLSLRGPSWETVQKCTDKYEMKKAFQCAGVHTSAFEKIYNEKDLERACARLRFPLIIKAVDQMGSRGVFKCETREEVFSYYKETQKATHKEYCILEEFLEGTMFGVEAMVENKKPVYILPVGNDLHRGNPPFPVGHYVPWEKEAELKEKIHAEVYKVMDALGADNCPMDFDMMLKDGEIYVIEATVRAGATALAELVGIHYGIDYYEAIVKLAMGEPVRELFVREPWQRTANITRILEAQKEGTVAYFTADFPDDENVVELSFNIHPGDRVRRMKNGRDRIGQVIIKGQNVLECRERLEKLQKEIHVEVKP
ncbi:MAG: ATP-grasp domain-containing protein [Eubacteriales bacterium]|nr:ATP-grasp domain-containing protein [Eubacteriales bacterium]